jgi:hypothetical protein
MAIGLERVVRKVSSPRGVGQDTPKEAENPKAWELEMNARKTTYRWSSRAKPPSGVWQHDGVKRLQFMYFVRHNRSRLFHMAPLEVHPKTGQYTSLCAIEAAGHAYSLFSSHSLLHLTPCPDCWDEFLKVRAVFGMVWCDPWTIPMGPGDLAVVTAHSQDRGRQGRVVAFAGDAVGVSGDKVYLDMGRGVPEAFAFSEITHVLVP